MPRHYRLRMENCVATILEIEGYLGAEHIRPEVIRHFKQLQRFLKSFSEDGVDEADIGRIEEATNQLLDEIGDNLRAREVRYWRRGWIN